MIKIILFCLTFVVSGCSNAPKPETQYFVLTPDTQSISVAKPGTLQNGPKKVIVLESIKLAEFLDQPGIVLQTNVHQIDVAHYHRWGEPLKRSLHRYILEMLTAQLPQHTPLNDSNYNPTTPYQYLDITVNQFNGTTDGFALLSSQWILKHSDSKTFVVNEPFSYQALLTNSGYPELVNQLANLLEDLCNDIASLLKASVEE